MMTTAVGGVDISGLGNLQRAEPIDLSVPVPVPSGPQTLPPAGVYRVRAPEFRVEMFATSQAGFLVARVDPIIVGGTPYDGHEIRFTRVSAKTYTDARTGAVTSQMAEYLRAFGIKAVLTGDPQQAADLVASTAGQEAEAYLNWVVEHRPSGFRLRGMKNFPPDGQGGYLPVVTHPDATVTDARGQRLNLRANVEVTRWIPRG